MAERTVSLAFLVAAVVGCGSDPGRSAGMNVGGDAGVPVQPPSQSLDYQACGTVGAVDPPTGDYRDYDAITALSVSADGRWLAAGRWTDRPHVRAHLWDLASGAPPTQFDVGSLAGISFEFSPSGDRLAAAGDERGVFDRATGRTLLDIWPEPDVPSPSVFNTLRFSPDGREVATGLVAGRMVRRLSTDGTELSSWPTAVIAPGVAYSPDGKYLATSVPELWRLADGQKLWVGTPAFPLAADAAPESFWFEHTAEFSPDGAMLLTADGQLDGRQIAKGPVTTRLYRVSDGTLLADLGRTLSRHARFSPDGRQLVAGDQVMNIDTQATQRLPVAAAALSAFLPDGRIVVADHGGSIHLLCPMR